MVWLRRACIAELPKPGLLWVSIPGLAGCAGLCRTWLRFFGCAAHNLRERYLMKHNGKVPGDPSERGMQLPLPCRYLLSGGGATQQYGKESKFFHDFAFKNQGATQGYRPANITRLRSPIVHDHLALYIDRSPANLLKSKTHSIKERTSGMLTLKGRGFSSMGDLHGVSGIAYRAAPPCRRPSRRSSPRAQWKISGESPLGLGLRRAGSRSYSQSR